MRVFLVLFGLFASVLARHNIITDYHESIGIPLAQKIKQAESAVDFDGSRIIGGTPSLLGEHPYAGGLIISLSLFRDSVCGCSLLSNTRIVTAAHCWTTSSTQARQFTVVLGTPLLFSGGTRVVTTNVLLHEGYNKINLNHDIAIAVIPSVSYTDYIQPIALPTDTTNNYVGTWAVAVGYGTTSDAQTGIGFLKIHG
ncbi:collagenase-like [Leptidea sinapis]|uniref:collagenase-like n=1 Tax=Leptidea sinapis TaxID=189913 RepID=UPI0021C499ED|nr:collagenase-like [Leptidea sinapis]